jgi:hypothetical protein
MQTAGDAVVKWSADNKTKLNTKKTKEMVMSFRRTADDVSPLTLNNITIDRVSVFKLLGVLISNDLSWEENTNSIISKCAPRLYYLKQLRRSGMQDDDLIVFYKTIVRPVLEYACPVWHAGLTKAQSDAIESVQKRALRLVFPSLSYRASLTKTGIETLLARRDDICKQQFSAICSEQHKLHHLLPPAKALPYKLRSIKLPVPKVRNKRYCSDFIIHSLMNYQ